MTLWDCTGDAIDRRWSLVNYIGGHGMGEKRHIKEKKKPKQEKPKPAKTPPATVLPTSPKSKRTGQEHEAT